MEMLEGTLTTTETVPLQMGADGVIRVGNTRVTLDTIALAFAEGATAEEIAQQYPSLSLADIYYTIGYYLRRQTEMDAYLLRRQRHAEGIHQRNEARFGPVGIRARLLARRPPREQ